MDSASKSHLGISAAPVPLLIRGAAFERLADSGGRSILGEGESAWADRAKMLVSAKSLLKFQALESKPELPKYTDKYAMPEGFLGRKADWDVNGDGGYQWYGKWCRQCPQDDPTSTFTCSLVNTADDGTEFYICFNCHEENKVKDKCGKSKPTRSDPFNLRHINAAEVTFESVCVACVCFLRLIPLNETILYTLYTARLSYTACALCTPALYKLEGPVLPVSCCSNNLRAARLSGSESSSLII